MIKKLCAKLAENFWLGGDLIVHGGGTQIFLDGGDRLWWEDSPFMGYGPPHPPHVSQPWILWFTIHIQARFLNPEKSFLLLELFLA